MTVSVDENTGAERTAKLTVNSGSLKKTLTVNQAKATGYVISLNTRYSNIYPADLDPTEFSYTVYKVDGESWMEVNESELLKDISVGRNPRIYLSWTPIGSHDICDYTLKISGTSAGETVTALNPAVGDCLFTLQLNTLNTGALQTKRFNLKRAAFLLGSPIVELAWTEEGPVLYTLYQLQMAKGTSKLGIYLNMTEVQHTGTNSFQMDAFSVCQSNNTCATAQSEQLENAAVVTIRRPTEMVVADGVTRVIPTDNDNMSSSDRWHPLKWYVENGNLYIWCLPLSICPYNPENVVPSRLIPVVTINTGTLKIANGTIQSSNFYNPPEY